MRFNVFCCCRFSCDSPTSDLDTRTPKGRGKRGRAAAVAANEANCDRKLRKGRRANSGAFTAPPSPAKTEDIRGSKRKGRPADLHIDIDGPKASKRSRSNSRSTPTGGSSNNSQASPAAPSTPSELIECPEPNCNKKYKHINGLRYHQSHAHHLFVGEDEEPMDEKDDSSEESNPQSPAAMVAPPSAPTPKKDAEKEPKEKSKVCVFFVFSVLIGLYTQMLKCFKCLKFKSRFV